MIKIVVTKISNGKLIAEDKGIDLTIKDLRKKILRDLDIDILDPKYDVAVTDITDQAAEKERQELFRVNVPSYETFFRAFMEDLDHNKQPLLDIKKWYDNNK